MKIFLAGASGVIGRNLIPRLVGAGHEVVGMTGDAAKSGLVRSLGARPVIVDVFDRDRLQDAVAAASPDAVIDQLTSLHGGDYAATNRVRTEGTQPHRGGGTRRDANDGGTELLHLRARARAGR